jgi:flagellar hook-length control protein FliK
VAQVPPAAVAAPVSGPAAPLANSAAPAAPLPTPQGPFALHQLPDALRSTIALSLRDGQSLARIQLAPASLGQIQIQLEHTTQGLVAHVVAEHADAAQALQSASGELRRDLEAGGTTVLRLDIQTSDGQGRPAQQAPVPGGLASRRIADGDDDAETASSAASPVNLGTPAGSLVDVLA